MYEATMDLPIPGLDVIAPVQAVNNWVDWLF